MITFHQPLWIAAGFGCAVLFWLLWRHYEQVRAMQIRSFAAEPLIGALTANLSPSRRRLKKWLLLATIMLCFTALARPQYGHRWVDVKHRGIDILFALDTSKSMLAEDVRPNRLERSKLAILDFVSKLTGDRVGLMPFAGTSYLMCPLTSDYDAFAESLMAVDYRIIPTGGTNIDAAIDAALEVLTSSANHKILIIVSDGEQLQGDVEAGAKRAAGGGMIVYTVGVGTENGELIPDPEGGFVRDDSGAYVKSRLDRNNLRRVADATGGLYADLGDQGQGLEAIYRQKLALIPPTELAEKRKQVPIERFGWPLALAIVLLSIEVLLSDRKPESNGSTSLLNRIARRFGPTAAVFLVIGAAAALRPSSAWASPAEDAYAAGNYIEAGRHYQELLDKDPTDPILHYNSGTAAYKNNLFEEAAAAFDRALVSDDLQVQEKSYYNRGNALYRLGESSITANPDQTRGSWERALDSYESALALNPKNEQAAANYAFVKEQLEQLKRQQNEQQNRQDQKDRKGDEQSDQSEQPSSDAGQDRDKTSDHQEQTGNQNNQSTSPQSPEQSAEAGEGKQPNRGSGPQQQAEQPGDGQSQQADEAEQTGAGRNGSPADQDPAIGARADTSTGGMSREAALQLLQAMKANEGRIDFYAPPEDSGKSPSKDW